MILTTLLGRLVLAAGVLVFACSSAFSADISHDPQKVLADWGIEVSATYIAETLGNVSGGIKQGTVYTGRVDLGTTIDLGKLVGWEGATFHANMYQIHGRGLSRDYIGNLMLVSGVEALPSTRLYELWIEQSLFQGRLLVKVGQQASDIEFIDSKYDDIFMNSALGWPGITGVNLPSGGPSPPLAVPGVRVKATLSDQWTLLAAIFDGDAAPPGQDDPQIKNPNGLKFRINDPPWIIAQLKYSFELGGHRLPGTISGGGWRHFADFADQRYTEGGLSLSDPSGSGQPRALSGNYGLFAVYEQLLARAAPDSDKGIAFFMRGSISPSDRNLVKFYLDGGFNVSGFSSARPDDKFGIAMTYAKISNAARGADRDVQVYTGLPISVRDFEAIFEMTYVAQIRDNWTVQPMFQYVIHPGGGAVDPYDPLRARRIKDAAVFGVRTTITY